MLELQEIRKFENAGLDVVVIGNNGEIDYRNYRYVI